MKTKFNRFFDAASDKWIKFYRALTILLFFLFIIAGIVGAIVMAVEWEDIILSLAFLVGGILVAFLQLVLNMLIIQLLNNVQEIRKKLETKTEDNSDVKADSAAEKPDELPEL